jgi:hypothetical protein
VSSQNSAGKGFPLRLRATLAGLEKENYDEDHTSSRWWCLALLKIEFGVGIQARRPKVVMEPQGAPSQSHSAGSSEFFVPSWRVDDRSTHTARDFVDDLVGRLTHRVQTTTAQSAKMTRRPSRPP